MPGIGNNLISLVSLLKHYYKTARMIDECSSGVNHDDVVKDSDLLLRRICMCIIKRCPSSRDHEQEDKTQKVSPGRIQFLILWTFLLIASSRVFRISWSYFFKEIPMKKVTSWSPVSILLNCP
ncbi:uncharacterized protein ACIGJ3_009057 [Trichechus inunguis]